MEHAKPDAVIWMRRLTEQACRSDVSGSDKLKARRELLQHFKDDVKQELMPLFCRRRTEIIVAAVSVNHTVFSKESYEDDAYIEVYNCSHPKGLVLAALYEIVQELNVGSVEFQYEISSNENTFVPMHIIYQYNPETYPKDWHSWQYVFRIKIVPKPVEPSVETLRIQE